MRAGDGSLCQMSWSRRSLLLSRRSKRSASGPVALPLSYSRSRQLPSREGLRLPNRSRSRSRSLTKEPRPLIRSQSPLPRPRPRPPRKDAALSLGLLTRGGIDSRESRRGLTGEAERSRGGYGLASRAAAGGRSGGPRSRSRRFQSERSSSLAR